MLVVAFSAVVLIMSVLMPGLALATNVPCTSFVVFIHRHSHTGAEWKAV